MKSKHQQRIEQFMLCIPQEIPNKPCIPNEGIRLLRAKLIMEEAFETVKGLGVRIDSKYSGEIKFNALEFRDYWKPNLIEIADGCADISVVTIGTLSACGIHDEELLLEVDYSNLNKFTGDGYKDKNGKWIKPNDWQPPDIQKILNAQN